MRRSRWDTSTRVNEDGEPRQLKFNDADLEICKILSPAQGIRTPWSYQYLPTNYFPVLLKRGPWYMHERLQELACEPFNYLAQPDQPHNNFRPVVYSIGANGIDELREIGANIPRRSLRALPHELMACLCAASFEYGTITKKVSAVTVKEDHGFYPDWPIFWLTTPHQQKRVFLEVDTGTEQLDRHPTNTTIEDKFESYLKLDDLKNTMVIFVTVRQSRVEGMIDRLKKVIDRMELPHGFARSFAFAHVEYDRFLTRTPKLTDWAVTADYQRAGNSGPFNFMKAGK